MKIIVGCPVSHREWILPSWWRHLDEACRRADVEYEVVMVGDAIHDPATFAAANEMAKLYWTKLHWVQVTDSRSTDQRVWRWARYGRLAELRNYLLDKVRELQPDAFLSLDSDILLDFGAIVALLESLTPDNAVGGKVFLSEYGTDCPSYANLGREGTLQRTDSSGTFRVDVIMAMKLMSPKAYAVDYRNDMQGEDTGWSKAAKEAGVKLVWDGRVASKHVFAPEYLGMIDNRVGF